MDLFLQDQVAVITGSSRGLGLASARALAAEGCRVVLSARGAEALEAARASIAATGSRVLAVQADVSTPGGAETVVSRALAEFGRIDILVNNVGKAGGGGVAEASDAEWQSALDQ